MKKLHRLRHVLLPLLVLLLAPGFAPAQPLANGTPTVTTSDGVRLYVRVAGRAVAAQATNSNSEKNRRHSAGRERKSVFMPQNWLPPRLLRNKGCRTVASRG